MITQFKNLFSDCEILTIEPNTTPQELMALYFSILKESKGKGFHPIILNTNDTLLEKFELNLEDENLDLTPQGMQTYRQKVLIESQNIDAKNFYQEEKAEMEGELLEVNFEDPKEEEIEFVSCLEDEESIKENTIIIKIPTDKPYEIFSWLPMGGFNDCPSPTLMTAMAKHWYETYGALPAAMSHDEVEFFVPNPPSDRAVVYDLGLEQFFFDIDIVEQGLGSIEALIDTIYKNKHWYFWWD